MSNYFKNIQLSVNPANTSQWENSTDTEYLITYSKESEESAPTITGASAMWPETTYHATVKSATDKNNNSVPSANVTIASANFTTCNDYPAFRAIEKGRPEYNGATINSFVFKELSSTLEPQSLDTDTNTTVDENSTPIITSSSSILNNAHLNSDAFSVKRLISINEPNIYNTSWGQAYSDSSLLCNYANIGTYFTDINNVSLTDSKSLYNFEPFNIRLGLHKLSAKYSWSSIHETIVTNDPTQDEGIFNDNNNATGGYLFDGNSRDEQGDNIISRYPFTTGDKINNNVVTGSATQFQFVTNLNGNNDKSVFLAVTEQGYNTKEDLYSTIEITAIPKSKKTIGSESKSILSLNYFTFAPPRIKMSKKLNQQTTSETDFGSTLNSESKTSITFANLNSSTVPSTLASNGTFSFDIETNENRPFLPLVNYQYNNASQVIGAQDVVLNNGYNSQYETIASIVNSSNALIAFNSSKRKTPCVIEILSSSINSDVVIPKDSASAVNTLSNNDRWQIVGATPSSDSNDKPTYIDNYFTLNDANAVISASWIKYPSTLPSVSPTTISNNLSSINSRNLNISWPDTSIGYDSSINTTTPDGSLNEHATLSNLIPGRYYTFRITAANFAGTTSKIFNIKTADPLEPVFTPSMTLGNQSADNNDEFHITVDPNTPYSYSISGNVTNTADAQANTNLSITDGLNGNQIQTGNTTSVSVSGTKTFSSAGTYTVTITPNDWYSKNSNNTQEYLLTDFTDKVYTIIATDAPTATVTTDNPTNVNTPFGSATLNGSASTGGSYTKTDTGFVYGSSHVQNNPGDVTPSNSGYTTPVSTGTSNNPFSSTLNSLSVGTYYYRAYLAYTDENSNTHYKYGEEKSFEIESYPTININIDYITRTTATVSVSE